MALKGKLEREVELTSPPEKFYNVWKGQAHHIPKQTPNNIQAVDLHEGDWETHGSIKIWKYSVGGKPGVLKERVEYDDEKKTITLNGLEGDVMQIYKVYRPIFQLEPKGEGSLAKCTIEYEKRNTNVPAPDIYMDLMVSLTKEIDEGLMKA